MKLLLIALTVLLLFTGALAQHEHHSPSDAKPAALIPDLGDVHHPVSTSNREAQQFFNQGFALVYGFNHDEAVRSFKRAAELDPKLAMAYWGVALALGPNINMPVDAEHEQAAFEALQKARSLAPGASESERAYIEALTKRYSNDPKADLRKLDVDYKNAMADVAHRFPDDLDAATLYAESIMDLRPWQFWTSEGKPAEGTEEMVAVLESVLRRNPDHLGANHYYIHAVEASPHPEWALPSAQRLKVLAPAAGHLVHMPAHIDIRSGNYEAAARSNAYAADADRQYFKTTGEQGMYPMMYYSHNLHFLAVANSMQGRYQDAKRAADQLDAHLGRYIQEGGPMIDAVLPMLDAFMPTPTLMMVRFRRWEDILKAPEPDKKLVFTTTLWHFARGMAYASTGEDRQRGERGKTGSVGGKVLSCGQDIRLQQRKQRLRYPRKPIEREDRDGEKRQTLRRCVLEEGGCYSRFAELRRAGGLVCSSQRITRRRFDIERRVRRSRESVSRGARETPSQRPRVVWLARKPESSRQEPRR